jgi:hypothetical protein
MLSKDLEIFKQRLNNATETGLNILEIQNDDIVDSKEFTQAIAVMQSNYSAEYSHEKVALLFDMIREEKWTRERFLSTFKWILKNRKFADWNIADWFSYSIKVYPYTWYLKQVETFGPSVNKQIEVYKISDDVIVYKYIDGIILPYERRLIGENKKPQMIVCDNPKCSKPRPVIGCCPHCGL